MSGLASCVLPGARDQVASFSVGQPGAPRRHDLQAVADTWGWNRPSETPSFPRSAAGGPPLGTWGSWSRPFRELQDSKMDAAAVLLAGVSAGCRDAHSLLRCLHGTESTQPTLSRAVAAVPNRAPMERIGVNILGPFPIREAGNRFVLVAMDYFTKWPEAYVVPDQSASTSVQRLVDEMFARFGVLDKLHSDQGRNFESRLFSEVCQQLWVKNTRTTLLHPQSDGMVERFNRTLATQLAILTSQHQRDWDQHLVLWAYRTAVQECSARVECTPAVLMFGRELHTPVDLVFGWPPEPEIAGGPELDYIRQLKEHLSTVHQLAREALEGAGARQKRAYDTRAHGPTLRPGDRVWVFCPQKKQGLSPKLTHH